MEENKTHYRKAFNSPYLSSADIVEPTVLTITHVRLEIDKTKKTKDLFNTAYFAEKELRPGEALKPMILNATNSRTMKDMTHSAFIEDWVNVPVTIYVDNNVKFGRDMVEGLRISTEKATPITKISLDQMKEIEDEMNLLDVDKKIFYQILNIKSVSELNSKTILNAKNMLEQKRVMLAQKRAEAEKQNDNP